MFFFIFLGICRYCRGNHLEAWNHALEVKAAEGSSDHDLDGHNENQTDYDQKTTSDHSWHGSDPELINKERNRKCLTEVTKVITLATSYIHIIHELCLAMIIFLECTVTSLVCNMKIYNLKDM